jgi:hypothetical protein
MSDEKVLTNNYNIKIFHPFLLNFCDVNKKNTHAIIPELISINTNTIEDYKYVSTNSSTNKQNIDVLFDYKYFLMYNFNITNIDDIFNLINNLIIGKNSIETINFMLNLIIQTYVDEINDIYIDKFIIFYKQYFKYFYNTEIEYSKIFKIFKNSLDTLDERNKDIIHSNIINNIISK